MLREFAATLSFETELKSPEPELVASVASALVPVRSPWQTIELTSFSTSLLAAARERCPRNQSEKRSPPDHAAEGPYQGRGRMRLGTYNGWRGAPPVLSSRTWKS